MIMTKFQKRILKIIGEPENALIVGKGFGEIEDLTNIFQTLFVVSDLPPGQKFKNLVYRENFEHLSQLVYISAVFFSLTDIKKLDRIETILNRWSPYVIIEGHTLIGRDLSKPLYDNKYIAYSQDKSFHVWKSKK
jgi:hypothetical protein